MKLIYKLILGFIVVALLSAFTGFFAERVSRQISKDVLAIKAESAPGRSVAEDGLPPQAKINNQILAVSLVITCIGIFAGSLVSMSVSRRFRKLSDAVAKIERGDPDAEIDIDSDDEIGRLAKSFRNMAGNLRETAASRDRLNREIEEHKKTEEQLLQSRNDCENTFNNINDMITIHDRDCNLVFANRAAKKILGLPDLKNGIVKCYEYFHGSDAPPQDCPGLACLEKGEPAVLEMKVPHLKRNIEIVAIPRLDSRKKTIGFIHIARDITKRKRADEKLKHHTFYDQLTNLPNRELFSQYLEHMMGRRSSNENYMFAVLFIDLDRFKVINDSLGHLTGDQLIVAVARRLETCLRNEDMISRFGGDEYVIFLENIEGLEEATEIADRIQNKLREPFNLRGNEVVISASIGIALSSSGYKNVQEILRDADAAMYRAKALGRSRYEIFDAKMHANAMNLLQLEADLRRAVKREEFLVYYQPIISTIDNSIIGVEALVRWNHPGRGIILPMEFIPVAEETGLITEIGERVLRTACIQNRKWLNEGYRPMQIRVNFSARQFQRQDLVETVKKVLRQTGMPPQMLNIEITESIAMEEQSIEKLNELNAMGIQISIDDFGTGYSSLGYLRDLPINTVKIDKSFVKDILVDPNAKSIVRAIIAMANNLRITVVAEGVETEDQKLFLEEQRCDKIQGFLYSQPVCEKDFTEMLKKEKSLLLS